MNTQNHSLATSGALGRASEDPIRDLPHDLYLKPLSPELIHLASAIFEEIEATTPGRSRKRKDATERRRLVTFNVLANLASLIETDNLRGSIILDMDNRKQTRYDRPEVSTRVLRQMVSEMERLGWLDRKKGEYRKARTTIRPSIKLWTAMGTLGIGPHVGRDAGAETIILKAVVSRKRDKVLVDYRDTEETRRLRSEVEAINECLAGADLTFAGKPMVSSFLTRRFQIESREAVRVFNKVGRLFGGWWQTLPRRKRHLIALGGEPLADLDFKAMFANLAYWRCGLPLPREDPYGGIDGLSRTQTKIALLALLCRSGPMRRLPAELAETGLGDSWSASKVEAAIRKRHASIASLLCCGAGLELMALESNIIVSALLELAREGVPALPMHDGLMVARSRKKEAWSAMKKASRGCLGIVLPVAEKPIEAPA